MEKYYLLKDDNGKLSYSSCFKLNKNSDLKALNNNIKIKIIRLLNKKVMYPYEVSRKLELNEQKVYYHINQMIKTGILEVVEKVEVRGTIAKKLRPKEMNFCLSLSENWQPIMNLLKKGHDKGLDLFFNNFVQQGSFDGDIIVGSPDPHGPYKARSRDGHYAIELSFFIGNIIKAPSDFSTGLDVDFFLEQEKNMILVGGPVTNQLVSGINKYLPIRFSEKKPWGIISQRTSKKYTDDSIGLICQITNPFSSEHKIIVIAGITAAGTKSAVIALTRRYDSLLSNYIGQKEWGAVIQGFDLDGDGKIDSIEILE